MLSVPAAVSRPPNPDSSDYYQCVEDQFEAFVQVFEDRFEKRYGFWRPYLIGESPRLFLQETVTEKNPIPGSFIAI